MKRVFSLIVVISLFSACSDGNKSAKDEDQISEAADTAAVDPVDELANQVFYPIPSPEQMFKFINEVGVSYSAELILDPKKAKNYTDPNKLALNFGVYTADLAYSAAYEDIDMTTELYQVVQDIADEIGIDGMMNEVLMKQVKENLQNRDSLSYIAAQAYYDAVDYLEQNEMSGKLALMSVGGWVESLYISLNSVAEFEEGSVTAQRIADQKLTFGNLYTFLKMNQDELGVEDAMVGLNEIRSVFASLPESEKATSSDNTEGKRLVLSSGRKISINQNQFENLKKAINDYRNMITSVGSSNS